jgi:hypothetical protein
VNRLRRIPGILAASVVVAVVGAVPAEAAQRYASPNGTPVETCTQASPCDLTTAVQGAAANDQVIVTPGTYALAAGIATPPLGTRIDIAAQSGRPRPQVDLPAGAGITLGDPGDTISGLRLIGSGAGPAVLALPHGGSADQMYVEATDAGGTACAASGSTWRNSVCWAPGGAGTAMALSANGGDAVTTTLRNLTLWAPAAGGVGLDVSATGGAALYASAMNSIVRGDGTGGGGFDVIAVANPSAQATVDLSSCNWATESASPPGATVVDDGGTGQTAPARFVDAAAGDFHERAGSPTIDAGATTAANGSADLDGTTRTIGAGTDIGAYEYVPPPLVKVKAASSLVATSVILNGQVTTTAVPATFYFRYGTTTAYGHSTPAATIGQAGVNMVAASLVKLMPGTVYHAQLVAVQGSVKVASADFRFRTRPGEGTRPTLSGTAEHTQAHSAFFALWLDRPATVTVTISRRQNGHAHAVHSIITRRQAGASTIRFDPQALGPGRYSAALSARNHAGNSTARIVNFTLH